MKKGDTVIFADCGYARGHSIVGMRGIIHERYEDDDSYMVKIPNYEIRFPYRDEIMPLPALEQLARVAD